MQNTYANGVFGINISQEFQGDMISLALLTEIQNRHEGLEEMWANGEWPADYEESVGEQLLFEFWSRLREVFAARGIKIPGCQESKGTFFIHQVDSHADINEDEAFNHGEFILGIGIFGFPNEIKFDQSFLSAALWHLWTVND